jgi:hypothetical protein
MSSRAHGLGVPKANKLGCYSEQTISCSALRLVHALPVHRIISSRVKKMPSAPGNAEGIRAAAMLGDLFGSGEGFRREPE